MKVLFLLEQIEVLALLEDPSDVNPGVGGTSYLIPQLAHRIYSETKHRRSNQIELALGCWNGRSTQDDYNGVRVVNLKEPINDQCHDQVEEVFDITVATGGALEAIDTGLAEIKTKQIVAWIHHPFDKRKISIAKKHRAHIVSIGAIQYLSNVLYQGRHIHIENLFGQAKIQEAAASSTRKATPLAKNANTIHIGYMGSLIPSKGLHCVLNNWASIKAIMSARGKSIVLHVIGGSKLYSYEESHPYLPCGIHYGERLEKLINNQGIEDNEIIFHGVLGKERYQLMADCDLAIVNPDGYGEAFPATILEWLSLGVPPITANRFGLGDVAQYIPELCIKKPKHIADAIAYCLDLEVAQFKRLRRKCMRIASLYDSKQKHIIEQWIFALECIADSENANDPRTQGVTQKYAFQYDEYPTLPMTCQIFYDYLDMLWINLKNRSKQSQRRLISKLRNIHRLTQAQSQK